ncbi:ubiquitin-like modifier-activating enzyme atg7 [Glossina fuscipes]|uniref:Ubiquitin-like modifier-activating enzyme ATG7 n=1 Tax=Glossina fuscipes TaxID=7396 RepID=A0A9C5Z8M8_9MUSC|nr:ubiquitin-like modifier-activating enzyme atg7 [Glossina fuscipes]
METEGPLLQFAPLQSFVSPSFWHKLTEIKIDFDRLNDEPKSICGYYSPRQAKSCLLEVDCTAFNSNFKEPKFCFKAYGTIYNKNTLEKFKETDKTSLLQQEGSKLLEEFRTDTILKDPSRLARFFILSFADLKNYNYYYWFGFPSPLTSTLKLMNPVVKLRDIPEKGSLIQEAFAMRGAECAGNFFILSVNKDNKNCFTLKEFVNKFKSLPEGGIKDLYFCFADNSEYVEPSWVMRVYVAFLLYKCPFLLQQKLQFVGVRYDRDMNWNESQIWQVKQSIEADDYLKEFNNENVKFVGWELNRNRKLQPRMISMKASMDPTILAENSVNLNLKLMKWRLLPDLNLNILATTKCLLFGAGTLGCAVARTLLGWGFKRITFVDSGKVSFSNPVRQYLYTHQDACKDNIMKSTIAAERIKEINPSVNSSGYVLNIPMPGHPIGERLKEQTIKDLSKLKDLAQQHDAFFLLTDSRESRWLPTLLGTAYQKIVINAALGFDSYLVQRHGSTKRAEKIGDSATEVQVDNLRCIKGEDLGCYFCNDVTAPGNSLKDRTLDQQCTVTRPGVSNIAASYAVELLVSLLQQPLKELSPAYYATTKGANGNTSDIPEGLLGVIPHSIRGSLFNYENILPATRKFTQCIACSEKVVGAFQAEGDIFLFKVFQTSTYLADLTDISKFGEINNEVIDLESDLELSD